MVVNGCGVLTELPCVETLSTIEHDVESKSQQLQAHVVEMQVLTNARVSE